MKTLCKSPRHLSDKQLSRTVLKAVAVLLAFAASIVSAIEKRYAFLVCGDPQYHAEKTANPKSLDPYSEEGMDRFIRLAGTFGGREIPKSLGDGKVSQEFLGMIVTGDLIDSADKNGGNYPAMQKFEWRRFKMDFGLTGKDGRLPYPVYELHGNHDGPQGDTFIIEDIIARNKNRPNVGMVSANGLHYSWDWGPLHLVNLGMFAGSGEKRREGHHYAPRSSLEFLEKDLSARVGSSGRPVILSFHLDPFGPNYDWPKEDWGSFWKLIERYNVVALFHGHTHGSPPSRTRWNGQKFGRSLDKGVWVFNPDDAGAAKTHPKDSTKGVGLNHGFLYVELIDREGDDADAFVVRSYASKDNWETHKWDARWSYKVSIPK